jgi:hypothetical protein
MANSKTMAERVVLTALGAEVDRLEDLYTQAAKTVFVLTVKRYNHVIDPRAFVAADVGRYTRKARFLEMGSIMADTWLAMEDIPC